MRCISAVVQKCENVNMCGSASVEDANVQGRNYLTESQVSAVTGEFLLSLL